MKQERKMKKVDSDAKSATIGKSTTSFGGSPFFRRKVSFFHWTWNKNTHFTDENQRKNSLRSADLTTIILLELNKNIQQQRKSTLKRCRGFCVTFFRDGLYVVVVRQRRKRCGSRDEAATAAAPLMAGHERMAFRLFHARRCATTGARVGLSLCPSSCVGLRWHLGEFPAFLACVVHTWRYGALFPAGFVSVSDTSCVWVLPVEY